MRMALSSHLERKKDVFDRQNMDKSGFGRDQI